MKREIKQYAHMSVRYTDESVTDDQSINPTNNIVRRTLVVTNKEGGGNTFFIKFLIEYYGNGKSLQHSVKTSSNF